MVFLAAVFALANDAIDFRPRLPKAGSIAEYDLVYRMKSSFTADEFRSRLREKVLGVRPDGSYVLRSESLGGYAILKGTRQAIAPKLFSITQFDPLGRAAKRDEPVVETDAMTRVGNGFTRFYAPWRVMKVGDTYGRILNSNDGEGCNDATLRFELVAKEKWKSQDVMRVSFTYDEKFTKVFFEGYWLIRLRDARAVVFRAKGTDVPYVPPLPAGDVTITMDLVLEK